LTSLLTLSKLHQYSNQGNYRRLDCAAGQVIECHRSRWCNKGVARLFFGS